MQTIRQALISIQVEEMKKRIHLSSQSEGIAEIDLEEMLTWARAFQVPLGGRFDMMNLFFHHLPSGSFAIGRATPAMGGKQEKGKSPRPDSFFLQYMVVDPETFLSFGNNPILVYQEALSSGELSLITRQPATLKPIVLDGVRKWFDAPLVKSMAAYPGGAPIAILARTVLNSLTSVVSGGPPSIHLISTLINLFPIHFRPELTFSSGVYFSLDHSMRIIAVSKRNPPAEGIFDFFPVPHVSIDRLVTSKTPAPAKGWGRLIAEILRKKRIGYFQCRLIEDYLATARLSSEEEEIFPPSAEDLDRLGEEWLNDLHRLERGNRKRSESRPDGKTFPDAGDEGFDSDGFSSSEDFFEDEENGDNEREGTESSGRRTNESSDPSSEDRIFRVRRAKNDPSPLPPLSLSEKLRRWLQANDPDDSVLFYREKGTGKISPSSLDPDSLSGSDSPKNRPDDSSEEKEKILPEDSRKIPRLTGEPPKARISHQKPLLIFTERNKILSPFQRLIANRPELDDGLMKLDGLVAVALQGEYLGEENLRRFWKEFRERLDGETEWTIREEYIHFIQAKLTFDHGGETDRLLNRSLAALDVLDLFLNEGRLSEYSP